VALRLHDFNRSRRNWGNSRSRGKRVCNGSLAASESS